MAAARAAVDGGGSESAAGEAAGGSAGDSGDEPAAELDAGHVAALQQLARSVLGNLQQLLAAPAQHTGGSAADTGGGSDETDAGEPAAGEDLDVHLRHADADEADAEADAAGTGQPAQQQQTLAQALQAAVHLAENAAELHTRPPKNVSTFSSSGRHHRRFLACSCRCARHLAIYEGDCILLPGEVIDCRAVCTAESCRQAMAASLGPQLPVNDHDVTTHYFFLFLRLTGLRHGGWAPSVAPGRTATGGGSRKHMGSITHPASGWSRHWTPVFGAATAPSARAPGPASPKVHVLVMLVQQAAFDTKGCGFTSQQKAHRPEVPASGDAKASSMLWHPPASSG